ncbi:MAG: LysR family transcriptional regulator [Ruegeria sp.]
MTTRIPSLNWLRVFEAAARTESFARAAVQLNMSAAAVSQQVRALETRLGTPLFHRHAHSVTLTEAGRAYLPSVQQSLLMLETATTGLFGESREQRLFVQSVLLFAHGFLAQNVPEFQTAHPKITCRSARAT